MNSNQDTYTQISSMYERIIEIIVFVIAELKENKSFNDIKIEQLQDLGYTSSEISTALSWLVDRIEFSDNFVQAFQLSGINSFRVLHDAERELFTPEAWGELIQLNALGIISNENIESLIERAVMMGLKQIDSPHLKVFVANSIFNVYANSLPGSRIMLQGNDTIN